MIALWLAVGVLALWLAGVLWVVRGLDREVRGLRAEMVRVEARSRAAERRQRPVRRGRGPGGVFNGSEWIDDGSSR